MVHQYERRLKGIWLVKAFGNGIFFGNTHRFLIVIDIRPCLVGIIVEQFESGVAVIPVPVLHRHFIIVGGGAVLFKDGAAPCQTEGVDISEIGIVMIFFIHNGLHLVILSQVNFQAAAVKLVDRLFGGVSEFVLEILKNLTDSRIFIIGKELLVSALFFGPGGDTCVNIIGHGFVIFSLSQGTLLEHIV